eukprot:445871-Prymnesium_polylepis.1
MAAAGSSSDSASGKGWRLALGLPPPRAVPPPSAGPAAPRGHPPPRSPAPSRGTARPPGPTPPHGPAQPRGPAPWPPLAVPLPPPVARFPCRAPPFSAAGPAPPALLRPWSATASPRFALHAPPRPPRPPPAPASHFLDSSVLAARRQGTGTTTHPAMQSPSPGCVAPRYPPGARPRPPGP